MYKSERNPVTIFLFNVVAIIIAYYVSILLHEWGHGTVAWLYGVKSNPFAVEYGGWWLKNVDENVDYNALILSGQGIKGALIGIAGFTVSFLFVIIAFVLLNSKSIIFSPLKFSLVYWFLIINMVPMLQYLAVSPFSSDGDTGQFVHGLNISGWWIFAPGIIFVVFAIWRILKIEIIKAYVVMPIKSLIGQNILLLTTIGIIFLLIYTHGYNPLTDKGMNIYDKGLALISILFVPFLFIICNPVREWVKKSILEFKRTK